MGSTSIVFIFFPFNGFSVGRIGRVMTSFGKYFDDQRQRLEAAMQNKNAQLHKEWRERYDERERKKQEEKFKKELEECSEKGVTEISEETKDYYKKKFASWSTLQSMMEKNDD